MGTYGCLPGKVDLRDYRVCAPVMEFPKEFYLTDLPVVKNQENVNSCVAHATSSILEYYAHNENKMSTNFIYGIQHKLFNRNSPGMYLNDACKIVTHYGDMLLEDCLGNTEIPKCYKIAEDALVNEKQRSKAYEYRIDSYYACNSDNDIKFALMNYGPVLCSIMWRNKYYFDKKTGVIEFDTKVNGGYHALMIYGGNEKGGLIQNSGGKSFGNNGRFVLPYSYGIAEAKCLIDHEEENASLVKPKTNKILNIIYKMLNGIINKFKGIFKC